MNHLKLLWFNNCYDVWSFDLYCVFKLNYPFSILFDWRVQLLPLAAGSYLKIGNSVEKWAAVAMFLCWNQNQYVFCCLNLFFFHYLYVLQQVLLVVGYDQQFGRTPIWPEKIMGHPAREMLRISLLQDLFLTKNWNLVFDAAV